MLVSLLATSCGDDAKLVGDLDDQTTVTETTAQADTPATTDSDTDTTDTDSIDASLTRDDVDCTIEGLDPDGLFDFTTAHYVVDGQLGAACLGEEDATLADAWVTLASIAPPTQLSDLALFGGFAGSVDEDEPTLAFVNTLDDDGTVFQMSVNLNEADADADELTLTMVHEFSHVFTGLSTQVDRSKGPESCATYFNGEGCYLTDSLMFGWIDEFWGNGLIERVDPNVEASASLGDEICDLDAGFFGPYAASGPEEDFAEAFSAWVLDAPVEAPERQARYDWLAEQPGLAEFQDRARAGGHSIETNSFEPCG